MDEIIGYAKLAIQVPDLTEISGFLDNNWKPHFNTRDYEGGWDVLPLRSPGGTGSIFPELVGGETEFADTPYMQQFTSVAKLVSTLKCPVKSVRLLNLKAGAIIKQHRDKELAFEKGEARIHLPVQTNDKVEFYVNDIRVIMQTGECWYINANMPHRVANYGDTDRIHLVIDCVVNDWLKGIFEQSEKTIFKQPMDKERAMLMINALREMETETSNRMADEIELKLLAETDSE